MDRRERKFLQIKMGLALLKVLAERRELAVQYKEEGKSDHKLVSSLRKLAAASGVDFGTVQKISKGQQGLEFFTFITIIEALDLDLVTFGNYFYSIKDAEVEEEMSEGATKKRKKK